MKAIWYETPGVFKNTWGFSDRHFMKFCMLPGDCPVNQTGHCRNITMKNNEDLLVKAEALRKQENKQESLACYKEYLLKRNALLWYAKLTENPHEAFASADLAFRLQPENEMAQRAITTVRKQLPEEDIQHDELIKKVIQSTGMTLIQARSVMWSFKSINLPIGEAFDSKTIQLRDLAWASENAYNETVRNAAKTVLLSHLLKIEPNNLPPALKIVPCSHYSEWQERVSVMFSGLLVGIMLMFSIFTIVTMIGCFFGLLTVKISWNWIGLFFYSIFLILFAYFSDRYLNKSVNYKVGRWGEEKAVEAIRSSLDGRWVLFRNFVFPNKKMGDIDLVLIGPGGIWVFEVKAYTGKIRNIGDKWQKKGRFGWYNLSVNPGKQARRNAVNLKEFFSENDIAVKWINPVVLWAGEISHYEDEKGILLVENPETPVWKVDNINEYTDEFLQNTNFSLKDKATDLLMKTIDNVNISKKSATQTEQKTT